MEAAIGISDTSQMVLNSLSTLSKNNFYQAELDIKEILACENPVKYLTDTEKLKEFGDKFPEIDIYEFMPTKVLQ